MYLLDTDTLTHLYAGNTNVVERLKLVADEDVGITIITKKPNISKILCSLGFAMLNPTYESDLMQTSENTFVTTGN